MVETSKFTGDERNEFLLFCDLVGINQLIETINHVGPESTVMNLHLVASPTGSLVGAGASGPSVERF